MRLHALVLVALWCAGCDDRSTDADASVPDGGPIAAIFPASTAHCAYAPLPPTARAGGTVTPGAIRVGIAELALGLPIGGALGGNTSRARVLDNQGQIDRREVPMSGSFNPSVGIETIPKVKALAITAGDETIVVIRTDTIFGDDTITHTVSERLGAEYAGKVLWLSSHTHTAVEQYSNDTKLQVGGGAVRGSIRARLIDRMVDAARQALEAREDAQIGIAAIHDFDPDDRVSYDRRPENDFLYGGERRKDRHLAVIRIDRTDGSPLAILPVFGVHSAILDDDVTLFSTDASGAYERMIEEQFDREVMVVHLQGAAGDVLGASEGHLEHAEGEPLWDFARNEENARWALGQILPVWEAAGANMRREVAIEMLTRSIPLGPDWRTFRVRGGQLEYAPFDGARRPDGVIFDGAGRIVSPIDEFNAPYGGALCGESGEPQLPTASLVGVANMGPYNSCLDLAEATRLLGIVLDFQFERAPLCNSTRTTISALRIGDYVFAVAPGEPTNPWADHVRELSPYDAEHTFVLGYGQGHVGYLLTAIDWLQGGFEPSINSWGPLEGEHIAERLGELLNLATTDVREDGAAGGVDRVVPPERTDGRVPPPDAAPLAGTVPNEVPAEVYFRGGARPTRAQPDAEIARLTGVARFVWIGEDPLSGTPRVQLQREVDGAWVPVRRRSGRAVEDLDMLMIWTPLPLLYQAARTHYWTLEWQAVSWRFGDALAERGGAPLGRYRFHVEGTGYSLDSEPFTVVGAPLAVEALRGARQLRIAVSIEPREGWRLLRMQGLSNRRVPLDRQTVTVEFIGSTPPQTIQSVEVTLDADGRAQIDTVPDGATQVRVRDVHGNAGDAAL